MKTKLLLSGLAILIITITNASVLTVSNAVTSPGQYTTIAAAMTAANNNDTIYIHGTNINYGSFTVTKSLTFIGPGHNPQNQGLNNAIINDISLSSGSSNTRIIGLRINNITTAANTSGITIARNMILGAVISYHTCPNWYVESNIFSSTNTNLDAQQFTGSTNWVVVKNVFNGNIQWFNAAYCYFYNNLFLRSGNAFSNTMNSVYFYNNIFYRATLSGATGCVFERNLSYPNNAFPNGTNQVNVNPNFVNFPLAGANFAYTYDFNLQAGSPAIDYGTDGEDIGLYGGSIGIYNQNGIPNIPQVREFNITSNTTVAPGGTININVKSTTRP
ncbi:MAG: hypothetical protein POELPBGB_00719 [Bacteroidia bacterium]|nr:hypothetical protein [Bacteroidia bacterium]